MSNPVRGGRDYAPGTPKFLEPQYVRRCEDCDLNGLLNADGRKRGDKRATIRRCKTCGGFGRLRLITRDRLRVEPALAARIGEPGWLFVSRKETLDPYMLDIKVPEAQQ